MDIERNTDNMLTKEQLETITGGKKHSFFLPIRENKSFRIFKIFGKCSKEEATIQDYYSQSSDIG